MDLERKHDKTLLSIDNYIENEQMNQIYSPKVFVSNRNSLKNS